MPICTSTSQWNRSDKVHKSRYKCGFGASLQAAEQAKADDPGCDVPVRRASSLILGLDAPLQDQKILVATTIEQESEHAANKVIHMQGHDVGACK